MARFSANLGFLWTELSLPDAILAAGNAGFDAVECHWPYDIDAKLVTAALQQSGLPMLGLNTRAGTRPGDAFGLAAVPGREADARFLIDEAIAYAVEIDCANIHVMAGVTDGQSGAEKTYRENLDYAAAKAEGKTILIEPLNTGSVPDYHLNNVDRALETIDAVGRDNVKLMFDCFHVQIMQGDLIGRLKSALPYIGHIQIAAVPDRSEPDHGDVSYSEILTALDAMGYDGFIGAEYRPRTETNAGLGWLKTYGA